MSGKWSEFSLKGCRFEERPSAAPTLTAPSIRLPDRVDLRIHCSPIENQLKTNSCVANAVIGALEFHHLKAGRALTDLSRLFVYYNARHLSDSAHQDGGSFIHHGMAAVLAHGACEARFWPFVEENVLTKPTDDCYKNASSYEAVQYARAPRGVQALTAIAQGLPIVFGIFVPGEYYQVAAETGRMPKPDQVVTEQPPSGHAMLIVGYDMTDRAYLVRNSWGPGWADHGYCWIPFETMDAWSRDEDFWTIGAIEDAAGFQLAGPSLSASMKGIGVSDDIIEARAAKMESLRSGLRQKLSGDLEAAKRDFRSRLRDKS
ncbi:MAG: C1 family peptidase [Hyphomonas sp.]